MVITRMFSLATVLNVPVAVRLAMEPLQTNVSHAVLTLIMLRTLVIRKF